MKKTKLSCAWPQTGICQECGAQFERTKSKRNNKTCGPVCFSNLMRKAMKGRTITPEWRKKISATLIAANVRGSAHPAWKGGPVAKTCHHCQETYFVKRGGGTPNSRRFCSHECSDASWKARSHLSPARQELGRIHRQIHGKTWDTIAEAIRQRDGYTCQACGKHQLRPRLDVHHIRRARDFAVPADGHIPSNLITLCRSCHIKVDRGSIACPPIPA